MFNPVSSYRIQFHKEFTFRQFEQIIPYLHKLGIKTIYASPVFEATPGSTHGYDVTNPLNINPEIGTLEELRAISKKLCDLDMNWLQDIVPNHMAFDQHNKWLMDVMESGRESKYADFFDIDWNSPVHEGKLMVPFLGAEPDEVIEDGQLKLIEADGKFFINSGEQNYPLKKESQEQLAEFKDQPEKINDDKILLKTICEEQHYALCFWQETDKHINYRRFFTVNGLICLNIQHQHVFDTYHQLIKQLVDEGIFQGLRVDHIDGLYDPKTYLENLRKLVGDDVYIIVEKILEEGESFPSEWPIQGNTGYDFLATVNNLLTQTGAKKDIDKIYNNLTGNQFATEEDIREKKSIILNQYMNGELDNLSRLFYELKLADDDQVETITPEAIKAAIGEMLLSCPVYRYYGNALPLAELEAEAIQQLLLQVRKHKAELTDAADLLENTIVHRPQYEDEDFNQRALKFYQRLMQFTGPLLAKGVEDTLMYTDSHFIAHDEVGDSPMSFGISIDDFHEQMQQRQKQWPMSMNGTSTHDTKRGEDVRARLNVLTDIPDEWADFVESQQKENASLKTSSILTASDQYFIYQTIAGANPMPGEEDDFESRWHEYLVKALREGKQNSNWATPNEDYESAAKTFASLLLDQDGDFWQDFKKLYARLADFGIINSLIQVLLKYTSPGMPDLYQGCELWDLSLVDPDNRRPVDYEKRQQLFDTIARKKLTWQQLWDERYSGQIKLNLTNQLLTERSKSASLFAAGDYIPLKIKGRYKENILAFARKADQTWYLTVAPLHMAAITKKAEDLFGFDWDDTRIMLPDDAPLHWHNVLSDKKGFFTGELDVNTVFADAPLALVKLQHSQNERAAGVLMHITSLPSPYGIGDIGPQAYDFADFLSASLQRYWQLLPANPVSAASGYSPYSSSSAMAGNVLLISPDLLLRDGLLKKFDLSVKHKFSNKSVDFEAVSKFKQELLDKAWQNFIKEHHNTRAHSQFEEFKIAEASWLNNYALYEVLKTLNAGLPWYQWPNEYKKRDKRMLAGIEKTLAENLDKVKWLQFVFAKQWRDLRAYCNGKNIKLFGDMPFYISYDSVDVWSRPELFNLDEDGHMLGVAGVPPDYFSADGQLWGMPVYCWDKLKESGYDWWLNRIKKNLEYFDLIRLDHFRAFAGYWEVPGGDETAVNGTWKQGPGSEFFEALKKELGDLPFVAEDLGEITEDVYALRDQFRLPGMKVLQFAFDETMPQSPHIPHNYGLNYFGYTGTHDNNTIQGWYEEDIKDADRDRIKHYVNEKPTGKNINRVMNRLCYSSVAKVAILPIQDVLGLDGDNRMNIPSSAKGNWAWRLQAKQLDEKVAGYLQQLVTFYNR